MASSNEEGAPWELYYWANVKEGKNRLIGRGEFVRLLFEAAGVPFIDHGVQNPSSVAAFVYGGGNKGFPIFAPPVIKRGDFVLSSTPAILRYLGKQLGLYPKNSEDEAHADSVMELVSDFITEGRLVFHPKCFTASYYEQVEEAKPYIAWFEDQRLGKFLNHFEKLLSHNNKSNSSHLFVIGDSLTYVDIALFHVLDAAQNQFPEAFERVVSGSTNATSNQPLTNVRLFAKQIRELPRIAAYFASDRRGSFEGNSMM
eukprot:TRINITY_DN2082_c0_g3_i1.p1 TRINITY_DN2082_c0_g3~~TRINITY_DN2082_c0_g3_i1.p1  ORF type:complete len:265 (+),score=57.66 TRINITY_DN2082_c0_g3_i1:26-796(+)